MMATAVDASESETAGRRSLCSRIVDIMPEVVFLLFKIGEAVLDPVLFQHLRAGLCMNHFGGDAYTCGAQFGSPHYPSPANTTSNCNGTSSVSSTSGDTELELLISELNATGDLPDDYLNIDVADNGSLASPCSPLPFEDAVNAMTADYMLYYRLTSGVPSLLLLLFCGAWSDRQGRRAPMVLSALATAMAAGLFVGSGLIIENETIFFSLILIGGAVRGITASHVVMPTAMYSYIADVTDDEDRTWRLGRLLAMNFFGNSIGSIIGGLVVSQVGFLPMFGTVATLNMTCVFLIIFAMRESNPTMIYSSRDSLDSEDAVPCVCMNEKSCATNLAELVRSCAVVLTQNRTGRDRYYFFFLFIFVITMQGLRAGESDVLLLFVQRDPLNWETSTLLYLLAVNFSCLGLSLLLLLPCLSRCVLWEDWALIVVGSAAWVCKLLVLAFSHTTWMVYLGVILGSPSAIAPSTAKAAISKFIDRSENGRVFALLGVGETLMDFMGSIVMNRLYRVTVDVFAGMAFSTEAFIFVVLMGVVVIIQKMPSVNFQNLEMRRPSFVRGNSLLENNDKPILYGSVGTEIDP